MKKWKRFASLLLFCFAIAFALPVNATEIEENEIAARLAKARELGLEEWVDEEGYLTDAFYEGKSDLELTEMGVDGLVRTMTNEELDAYVARLNAGISLYTVTYYKKVSQVNPSTGGTLYTGVFEVDGTLAYCIERSVTTPAQGASTGTKTLITNDKLRKVLYYGYNGPQNKGYTYVETALAAGEANGDGDNSLGRNVLAAIVALASPPAEFKVWKVQTNGGSTQDLAFYTMEEKGHVQIKKVSSISAVTEGNENYSLSGAVYGIYSDSACKTEVGRLTTDATGVTGTISVSKGTYYVKEITAPLGYLLNEEIKTATVTAAQTLTVIVSDKPEIVIPDTIIQKQDSQTGEAKPQGNRTFENAQFLVKFFGGEFEEGENPESGGVSADKQWIFATDSEGKIQFQTEYFVSGDTFWTDEDGQFILPLGTITIQEIQAPEGYLIHPDVFVQKLASGENTFETVLIMEEAIQPRLPETGSEAALFLQIAGVLGCLTIFKKEENKR